MRLMKKMRWALQSKLTLVKRMRRYPNIAIAALVIVALWYVALPTLFSRDYSGVVPNANAPSTAARIAKALQGKHTNEMSGVLRKFLHDIRDLHPSKGAGGVPPLVKHKAMLIDDLDHLVDEKKPFTVDLLHSYLDVDEQSVATLRELHKSVIDAMPRLPLELMDKRGVVLTGGGKLFGQSLIAIKYLNKHEPDLPIELWMAREEYEPEYCDNIFPLNNVQCMVVEDFFGSEIEGFDYMGFPLKALALAGSRFSEIFFMDVDCFPLMKLDDQFSSKPYNRTGFISWPDYWPRVTAPEFYDVSGLLDLKQLDTNVQLHEIPGAVPYVTASETGQIVIDKKEHWDTLLLSAYYNLNGKDYYYPLLSQSLHMHGFGDKETFISAAYALGHEVYQVKHRVGTMGYHAGGEYHGKAIVQQDPIGDYRRDRKVMPFALHANTMKLDPYHLFGETFDDVRKPNQYLNPERSLGKYEDVFNVIPWDVELELYEAVQQVVCEWLGPHKPSRAPEVDRDEHCKRAVSHVKWLRKNPNMRSAHGD